MEKVIILSPCKEMNRQSGNQPLELTASSELIIEKLRGFQPKDLAHLFKLSDPLSMDVFHDYQTIKEATAKPAYATYRGLAFRQFNWDKIDIEFAKQHLYILSALYGPISPQDLINPYRLDFNTPLRIESQSLKEIWRPLFNESLKGKFVYNLASKEFSQLINPQQVKMVDIEFFDAYPYPKKAASSAVAKKLRGQLANHLLLTQDFSQASFQAFTYDNYAYSEESVFEEKIIYIKK